MCVNNEGIVLRGNRIVLPTKLQKRAIKKAHEDHAGMTKCKQSIRSKLWWPQMDKHMEAHIQRCHAFQVTSHPPKPEPLCPTKVPSERWSQLAIDICGPFPTEST